MNLSAGKVRAMPCFGTVVLDFPSHAYWYEAIRADDKTVISKELHTTDVALRSKLMMGNFDMETLQKEGRNQNPGLIVSNAWHLAVALCSVETLDMFLARNVDIHTKDLSGYNIIHTMILTAAFEPESEDILIEKYWHIVDAISTADKKKLLLYSKDGMRPLEFAMHNATTGLFQGE